MTAAVCGGAWAALVIAVASCRRPRPSRLDRIDRVTPASPARLRPGPLQFLGHAVLTGLLRRPAAGALIDTQAGAAALGLVAGTLVWLPLGLALGPAAWWLPRLQERARHRRRRAELLADLPDVVDLFSVAVSAGLTVPRAVEAVARRATGPLGLALRHVDAQVHRGRRVSDALEGLVAEVGDPVRPLVAALADSDRYGAPLAAGLDRLAAEVRLASQRRAEETARKVPVKLLFPLVLCVLPAFALLTMAPLIASGFRSLRL